MKQTNNAIKFLMAQYRAIFKNANLKMFLAAATAAALAAGSAQAATTLDSIKNGEVFNASNKLEITSGKADSTDNEFTVRIEADAHTIDSNTQDNQTFTAKSGTIVMDGKGSTLTIGAQSGAIVTLKEMKVLDGELVLKSNDGSKKSELTASTITIGAAADAQSGKAQKAAKVTIGTLGKLTGTVNVLSGGTITADATDAKQSIIAGSEFNVGKGGVVTVGTGKALSINSGIVTVEDGGKLTLVGGGSKVVLGGKNITLTGSALEGHKGTLDLGAVTNKRNIALNVDAANFGLLFKDGTLNLDGTQDQGGKLTIQVLDTDPNATIDLVEAGFLKADDGKLGDKFTATKSGAQASVVLDANKGVIKAGAFDPDKFKTVELEFADLTVGKATEGTFDIKKGAITVGSKLSVVEKTTADNNKDLTVSAAGVLNLKAAAGTAGVVDAKKVTVSATNETDTALNVLGGNWSIGNLAVTKGVVTVDNGATLTLNKDATVTTPASDSGSISVKNASTLDLAAAKTLTLETATQAGTVNLAGGSTLKVSYDKVFKDDKTLVTTVKQDAIASDGSSELFLNVADDFTIDGAGLDKLIDSLSTTKFKGFISFSKDVNLVASGTTSMKLSEIKSAGAYGGITGTTTDGNVDHSVMIGNIKVESDTANVTLQKDVTAVLYQADKDGYLVRNNKGAADVTLNQGSSLTLAGEGKAGAIEGSSTGSSTVEFGHAKTDVKDTVSVESIGATNGVSSVSVVKGKVELTAAPEEGKQIKLQTKKLSLSDGTSLTAKKQDIVVSADASGDTTIFGDVSAKSLSLTSTVAGASYTIGGDAMVDVGELTLNDNMTLNVGVDGPNGASATLETDKLTLAGGSLIVDPDWEKGVAIAAVKSLSDKDTNTDAQILDGKIAVGMNSVAAVGYGSRPEVESLLNTYGYLKPTTDKTALDLNKDKGLEAALLLNTPLQIAADNGVLIDSTAGAELKNIQNNKFEMKGNSALIVTDKAFQRDSNGKLQGPAVALAGATTAGAVSATGNSKVILAGAISKADSGLQIFAAKDASTKPIASGKTIAVETANGILATTIGDDGTMGQLDFKDEAAKKAFDGYYSASAAPVQTMLKKVFLNEQPVDMNKAGAQFVTSVANDPIDHSGVKADAAAHAATYAGAQVAAVASVGTMADAVVGRIGSMGVETAVIQATGSQANGGVWLTPMYKSVDADGFNAEGATYGADVDLGGVAFGADTVNGNMRFGAVFNIGSGDADGKGNGSGLKDEFDYYGFGIYSAMGFGNFALVGDASLNVISHDVKHAGLDAKGSADTTAVTMGITGQYTIANPMVDVTPHLGARFIRLDTDSYDLVAGGEHIATTDYDVQNVFSIPLGVTLSKAFEMGGWSLAPSADLTLTFNTGDTDVKSTTQFTGVKAIDLTTEVLDEVTYGVAVGLGAQYGAFGTNIGINYTGSSNTDSFGVNANARYMF